MARFCLSILVWWMAWAACCAQQPDDLSELCARACRDGNLPGCALLAVKNGRIVGSGVAGVRRRGGESLITIDDKFHLGSCTKAMTAIVAGKLVDAGKIRWETTIGEVLGERLQELHADYRDATLRQLLGHRAGVPGKPAGPHWAAAWRRRGSPQSQRWEFAKDHLVRGPVRPPGTCHEYSNAGYTIAAVMLEAVSGQTWEVLMRETLFQPLKMQSAGYGPAGSAQTPADQPWGHQGDRPMTPGRSADNPDAIGPGGKVHASLPDMARYLIAVMDNARGKPILVQPETMRKLLTPLEGQQYAQGWIVVPRTWAGGMAANHAGSNTMNHMVIWLAPQRRFAMIAATNVSRPNTPQVLDQLASAMVNRYSGK